MFWIFILVAALAFVLIRVGMLSVWVSVFSMGLQAAMLVIGIISTVLIWRWAFRTRKG